MNPEFKKWLQANLGKRCLAPLTGTDCDALCAATQIVASFRYEIYESPRALQAFATMVERMQPSTRAFAFHAIAMVMDWPDRERLWAAAELQFDNFGKCACESQSRETGK